MPKILALSASTMGTTSRALIETILPLADDKFEIEVFDFKEHELVFADGRDYRDYSGSTQELIQKILEVDAIIISMPIYQSSIPGSLKNVFDLLPIDSLRDKVIGIVASAGSEKHFLVPEYQLKPILKYMKAEVLDSYVFVTGEAMLNQKVISDDINLRFEQFVQNFEAKVVQSLEKQALEDALYDF